jgi:hypothetical protein
MIMRRNPGGGTDLHRIEAFGAGEDADDEVVERVAGSQQEACVEGAAGDVDEGSTFGDKT